ncbi:protein CROWDED NUCLEI 2 isoform X4 [Nilaparvata lugens]|uniref:protein CROWDED NUCLEI 2 isoform X4 n=1 Tax=Nilaparvata lugens TaxID=108931 RepID=UPI00193CB7A5|nr:protein CROWDED NUCLEI 2 isoform X4 [Nilaparvata lugens]
MLQLCHQTRELHNPIMISTSDPGVLNDSIFKAFLNLFDKCDTGKSNVVQKTDLVKVISSSAGDQNPNIEDIIENILGLQDDNQLITKNEFIRKIEKYIDSNQECVGTPKEQVTTDYFYYSPHHCSTPSDSSSNELKRLETICDDLTVQVQNAEEQNTKLRHENYLLSTSYNQLSIRSREQQQLLDELQLDVTKRETRCSTLQRRLADCEQLLEKERERGHELQATVKRKSDDLAAVVAVLKGAQKENDERRGEMVELERKLELKEDECAACCKKLSDLESVFESEMVDCLEKIETLEKRNHFLEVEMIQALNRIEELEGLNKDLEIKHRILEDSTALNVGEPCFESTVTENEINEESCEMDTHEVDHVKPSTGDSGCFDTLPSLRDEIEAVGESVDTFVSFEEFVNQEQSDLANLYKINDQQKTIDSLTELVATERQNNKLSSEELEKCKRELCKFQETVEILKQEKQRLEDEWKIYKLRQAESTSQTKISKLRSEVVSEPKYKDLNPTSKIIVDGRINDTQKTTLQILESEVDSNEDEITDVALVVYQPLDEMKADNCSKSSTRKKRKRTPSRLGSYSFCVCTLLTLAWLLQWTLRESAVSCLSSSPSAVVRQLICPYVHFRWNEPPPF